MIPQIEAWTAGDRLNNVGAVKVIDGLAETLAEENP